MQVISHSVDSIDPKFKRARVVSFDSNFFLPMYLRGKGESIFIFLSNNTGYFTSGEHGVHGFKEFFRFNFSISKDENS